MSKSITTWLLVGLFCLALWPAVAHGQSAELSDANNRFSELYAQARYQEALPFAEEALRLSEREFGPDHPVVATKLNGLAELYLALGRHTDAEPLYQRSLAIREKALGPEHPDVGQSLDNLAGLYKAQGRYAEAEPLFKRSLAIKEKVLGPEHPKLVLPLTVEWSPEEVRAILAERIDKHEKSVGIAVGLLDERGSTVVSYGKLSKTDEKEPDGKTVFEIGSITKVFTSILLADFVGREKVRLDDPVQKFLPDSVRVPSRDGTVMTLYHLATHTSGLPRMPDNFAPADPTNPYVDYTVEQMYEFLSGAELTGKPGASAAYSNYGAGLLGHILALQAGSDYETLVRKRIAGPLEMTDTVITLTPELENRLAQGHDATLEPAANWDIPTLAGAGALRSTVDDMLLFLAANLGLTESPISDAMEDSHRRREEFGGPEKHIGLGWFIRQGYGRTIHGHSGETGGYRSFVGFDKERKKGVVVLSNSTNNISDIGFHLLVPEFALAKFSYAGAQRIPYKRYVTLSVGQSTVIHGARGACGEAPPDWEEVIRGLPLSLIGSYSDGGLGVRRSRSCGGPTPARAVKFTAEKAGSEQIVLYGDPINITVK